VGLVSDASVRRAAVSAWVIASTWWNWGRI
jgi:hypothetical protein